jgi:hypothetical protein
MTFSLREISLFGGEPVGLIRFKRGAQYWRYTTGMHPVQLGAELFEAPGGVSRSAIQDSSQRAKNRVTITLPPDLPVASNWLPFPTPQPVLVECLSWHRGDDDFAVEWSGRVLTPKFHDTKLELLCEPTRAITRSRGNNLRWQRGCPLPLYSKGLGMCNADEDEHKVPATIESISGLEIVAPEFASLPVGRLAGGFLRWTRPDGDTDYRTIMAHLGDTIVVDFGTDALAEGDEAEALPGCNHTWSDCEYFENTPNYGGVLTIPRKSPHDGDPT